MFAKIREEYKEHRKIVKHLKKAEESYLNKDIHGAIGFVNKARREALEKIEHGFKEERYMNLCTCLGLILNEYAKAEKERKEKEENALMVENPDKADK